MSYSDRRELYEEIEDHRGRPLITYITSTRIGASGQMLRDTIPHVTRQLSQLQGEEHEELDLLVVSIGGDPTVSWRINSLIRERFDQYSILLPSTAHSAATLLALGADEIVMHAFANLGPVDPQIPYFHESLGQRGSFSSEDLRHFIEFVREEVGLTDQKQLEDAFEFAADEIGPTKIGSARRSSHLSMSMAEKLLDQHMDDEKQASAIAEDLNRSFYHHGYPLARSEAEDIGLPVEEPEGPLRDLLRKVWRSFEEDMRCAEPFDATREFLQSDHGNGLLESLTQYEVPAGMGQKQVSQVFNYLLQNNLLQANFDTKEIEPADYEIFYAAVESLRAYSQHIEEGKIFAQRLPDGTIETTTVPVSARWKFESDPSTGEDSNSGQTENGT